MVIRYITSWIKSEYSPRKVQFHSSEFDVIKKNKENVLFLSHLCYSLCCFFFRFFIVRINFLNHSRQVFGVILFVSFPTGIYMFKLHNRNTTTRCEVCSKLTIKTLERRQWLRFGVFIVNFEHISHLVLVFLLLTLNR